MTSKNNNLPLVVIFGRANVGKSTLFNTLREKRQALVSPLEGTTRDANVGIVSWRGTEFKLVDTGGIIDLEYLLAKKIKTGDIEARVQRQSREYLRLADLILFVVDAKAGLSHRDKQLAILVKKITVGRSDIIYVINKVDGPRQRKESAEFYKLPLGEPLPVSATTGSGTGDLLDIIVEKLKVKSEKLEETEKKEIGNWKLEIGNSINVCIIGKPNVGKSSLLNAILGEERVIVSSEPHTTREPQDTYIEYEGQSIKLIDTAGITKKGQRLKIREGGIKAKTEKDLITMGIAKSLSVLGRADIALLVIDTTEPLTHQDQSLVEKIIDRKKSLLIIANKWDLVAERDTKKFERYIYGKLPFVAWAPIQFISAKTGEKVKKIMDLILQIEEARQFEISDSAANTFMMRLVKIHRPSRGKGVRHPRVRGFRQIGTNPPKFEIRIGSKEDMHASYLRFVENRLREKFKLLGTPIAIRTEKGKNVHGTHNK